MAKDVTIYQKSTSYHYSSVDHIQTKGLDEESYVQWIPEAECITGYKKITKNGQYLASADGVAGYTAVFVNVPLKGMTGTGPDGEVYRVWVDPSGYLRKTVLSTGQSVPLTPNYIGIPAQEYQGSDITSYMDSTVNVIGESAFASCVSLSTVEFPKVHTVKKDAFSGCTVLSNISFPMLETIDEGAFQDCVALTSVSFPECTFIGTKAFQNCSGLQTIDLSGSNPVILDNADAFSGTTAMVMVPSNLFSYYVVAKGWSDYASRISIYGA